MAYRDHFEIVLWDQGVNIWHVTSDSEKLTATKTAFSTFSLEKNRLYKITVLKRENELTVIVGSHIIGYHETNLPATFFVGIAGHEGVCRFYDFAVESDD